MGYSSASWVAVLGLFSAKFTSKSRRVGSASAAKVRASIRIVDSVFYLQVICISRAQDGLSSSPLVTGLLQDREYDPCLWECRGRQPFAGARGVLALSSSPPPHA